MTESVLDMEFVSDDDAAFEREMEARECYTKAEFDEYKLQYHPTEGFGITSSIGSKLYGGIVSIDPCDEDAVAAAKFAIKERNGQLVKIKSEGKECLHYAVISRACKGHMQGIMHYITLKAKDNTGKVEEYRAKVWTHIGRPEMMTLEIFRPRRSTWPSAFTSGSEGNPSWKGKQEVSE